MKRKLLHTLSVLAAFLTAIPIANAAASDYNVAAQTPGKVWSHTFTLPGGDAYQAAVLPNGYLYVIGTNTNFVDSYKTLYRINESGVTTGSAGYTDVHYGLAADDNGRIILLDAPWNVNAFLDYVSIRRPKADDAHLEYVTGSHFSISAHNLPAYCYYIDATGDLENGTGYIWFPPVASNADIKVVKTVRTAGQNAWTTTKTNYTLPFKPGRNDAYMQVYESNEANNTWKFLFQNTGENLYDCTLSNGTITATPITLPVAQTRKDISNSHIFFLGGHKMLAYNTGTVTRSNQFIVYDMTTKTTIATVNPFSTTVSGANGMIGSWINSLKVSETQTDLFIYSPAVGASRLSLNATPITNPVTSLSAAVVSGTTGDVKVTWAKPSAGNPTKYAVSYSTNGGTSWSAEVETTNLNYTYANLANGTYTFKVRPYYGGSSTWGQTTTSNSVTTVDPTTPVGSATAAVVDGTLDNVTVTWTKPSTATPSKYAVSYSNNGGTSWSTPVETTGLSYTFSNLTPGTYTFKVVPYYANSWGNETVTASVEVQSVTGYKFTTTKLWEVAGTWGTNTAPDGRSIAVSNNKMYVASSNTDTKIAYVAQGTSSASWPTFESGFTMQNYGLAMDNDDAGNIIMASGVYFGSADGFAQLSIYPAGATSNANKVDIPLSGDYLPGSRCDFIAAQGNLLSAAGGYVWFAPINGQKIMRIKIANGALAGITAWTQTISSTTNTNQILVRPLNDGRLYFHYRSTGYRIITLPPAGEAITADMIESIPASGYACNNLSSDIFTLQGYTFHVRNDGTENQSIGVTISNLTDEGNGDASFVPFDGTTPAGGTSDVSGIIGYGTLVRAVNVDDLTTDVYCYSPNHGVTVYRVTAKAAHVATDALGSLTYNYSKVDAQQNIELTWTAPDEATPSAYKIYRDNVLLATVDASTLTYTDRNVTQNCTYKVVPIFTGATENGELGLEVTTSGVETVLYAPIITEKRSYDGYSLTQIFYQMPSENKVKPQHFNIYRNGVLLEGGMTMFNYIDDTLPKTATTQTYVYTIEAVYSEAYGSATRMSEPMSVDVAPRDWALTGYGIDEIYNVPVNRALGNFPNNFDDHEYYRQGYFYDGHWYIAQLADQLSRKDQGIEGGAINKSEIDGSTGGVVVIGATEEIDVRRGFTGKIITNAEFENVGIAMDDKGTIFMRRNNDEKLKATIPIGTTWNNSVNDAYDRRITEGVLYQRDANGNYPAEPTAVIDLTPLWTSNDWINKMYYTGLTSYGQVTGRSDYFNMYGDVMSAEGGYLLLSPSWTRTIFKVKIVNGAYSSHETLEFHDYTETDANGVETTHKVTTGAENYGFKIDGRDAWMAQIRSNGYFGIHNEQVDGEYHWHAIYDVESRVNNSGGTSIVAFNSEEGKADGETFLITPASMYSRNQGDFIVTRGIKENVGDDASASQLAPPMPVVQYKQTTQNTNIATNANGNWFHAEHGTYESASSDNAECVYIYQYVPGVRFAKYRLYPEMQFPAIFPTLDINTEYGYAPEDANKENPLEITHFSGVSTWKRPKGFGTTDASNANVKVKSYTFELLNAKGNVVYSDEVLDKDYEAGTAPTVESEDIEYKFDYYVDKNIASTNECDLDFQTYTARVAVNYEFQTGAGGIHQSVFGYARANNDYTAVPAQDLAVHVFKQANSKYSVENADGTYSTVTVDNYRVELDFNAANGTEPVTHYTVRAARTAGGVVVDTIDVTDFQLHNGMKVVSGIEQANYIVASEVPGTYDFRIAEDGGSKAPFYHKVGDAYGTAGQSRQQSVLTWHHRVAPGTYGSASIDEPSKWIYYVDANYAAKNRYIAKSVPNTTSTQILVETGVEVIGNDITGLKIYPIPATTAITIKSPVAINSIVIYNEAGAEVMTAQGYDETIVEVNIENLATGYYFVKVDGNAPVKIVKK